MKLLHGGVIIKINLKISISIWIDSFSTSKIILNVEIVDRPPCIDERISIEKQARSVLFCSSLIHIECKTVECICSIASILRAMFTVVFSSFVHLFAHECINIIDKHKFRMVSTFVCTFVLQPINDFTSQHRTAHISFTLSESRRIYPSSFRFFSLHQRWFNCIYAFVFCVPCTWWNAQLL